MESPACFCLSPLSQTYHMLLSSITIVLYVKNYLKIGDRQLTKTKIQIKRALIKNKIDRIEDISQDDFDNLTTAIRNLRNMSHA